MLFKPLITATLSLLLGSPALVTAHEAFEESYDSVREPENITELLPYGIEHRLDQPMDITTDFFFDQIVKKETFEFHQENIMSKMIDGKPKVPGWVIQLTVENNPRYVCKTCGRLNGPMVETARMFHIEEPELNFIAAKVNCGDIKSALICDYFQVTALPRLFVLRPDFGQNNWFLLPNGELARATSETIVDFMREDYFQAFSQGTLQLFRKTRDADIFNGFVGWIRKTLMYFMEENYSQMYDMGFLGPAKDHYFIAFVGAASTMWLPLFVFVTGMGMMKMWKNTTGAKTVSMISDPDFEPEPTDEAFPDSTDLNDKEEDKSTGKNAESKDVKSKAGSKKKKGGSKKND